MEAQKLRIGNLFFGAGMVQTVNELHKYGYQPGYEYLILCKENKNQYKPIEIEGIPLTEEWLLKFGFEIQHNTPFYSMVARKDGFCLKVDCVGKLYFSEGYFNVQPKSVHQLQNLYFALTGKELTIK